ncbi:Hypothetical_protein [Hexamita inflata]|uniref:Hypothetical_protein n=1 Tax=Hexamita inflata TaxID=28002 RepID=A0AA86TFF0_9EUKA|nr:Hypothetical protein HINF_LOCUS3840 [Hexamita inflata]
MFNLDQNQPQLVQNQYLKRTTSIGFGKLCYLRFLLYFSIKNQLQNTRMNKFILLNLSIKFRFPCCCNYSNKKKQNQKTSRNRLENVDSRFVVCTFDEKIQHKNFWLSEGELLAYDQYKINLKGQDYKPHVAQKGKTQDLK